MTTWGALLLILAVFGAWWLLCTAVVDWVADRAEVWLARRRRRRADLAAARRAALRVGRWS